jgi:hypothetical protein
MASNIDMTRRITLYSGQVTSAIDGGNDVCTLNDNDLKA